MMDNRQSPTSTGAVAGQRYNSTKPQSSPESEEIQAVPRRIYILGTGSIGKLVAHSLRSLPNPPPVTLLLHKGSLRNRWRDGIKQILLTTNGVKVAQKGFDVELARPGWRRHGRSISMSDWKNPSEVTKPHEEALTEDEELDDSEMPDRENTEPIHNLIVTVKAGQTVGALLAIKNRLGPDSSILFLQNGVGIVDQVDEELFPDPSTRPEYMVGIVSHGVHSQGPFEATHAGFGTIAIGLPIRRPTPSSSSGLPATTDMSASSKYILQTICRAPVLAAVAVSPTEILQAQLEKLAVNAIINPMTALIDARNGAILYNYSFTRAQRLLLAEISLVIRSLPELKPHPNLATRFSAERLESMVVAVAKKTADNISSMLADVRQGKRTEIDYINGYIVKRGEELGITCFMNYLIMQLVKGKQNLVDRERYEELPLARSTQQPSN